MAEEDRAGGRFRERGREGEGWHQTSWKRGKVDGWRRKRGSSSRSGSSGRGLTENKNTQLERWYTVKRSLLELMSVLSVHTLKCSLTRACSSSANTSHRIILSPVLSSYPPTPPPPRGERGREGRREGGSFGQAGRPKKKRERKEKKNSKRGFSFEKLWNFGTRPRRTL